MDQMLANYHTHTPRCRHAEGSEREYIENAVRAGIKTFGFSDHSPYFFKEDGYYSTFRMYPEEFDGYVETLLALREEYRGVIDILIGVEAEYYPAHFGQLMDFLSNYPLDYMIMGQHFLDNEYDNPISVTKVHEREEELAQYADQVIEGIETGKFSYLAHPDIFRFVGDDDVYYKHMKRVCETAKKLDLPLEVNFLGFSEQRGYPSERFFSIAAEVGNEVIFGCDAHRPDAVPNREAFEACSEWMARLGLVRTERIKMTMRR